MKTTDRKATDKVQKVVARRRSPLVTKESLGIKPVYGYASRAEYAQEVGGGTASPVLGESRLYTAGRSLRS